MANLAIERKLGERRPVSIRVTYPEGYNLSAAAVKFWLDGPTGLPVVAGAAATATDVTGAGLTAQTVWKLTYAFDADDLVVAGTYKGEFEIDFGAGMKEYYPQGKDVVKVTVREHPAAN